MNESNMKNYVEAAKRCAVSAGYDWLILTTHAYHETGGFEHIVGRNNYWGLKKPLKSSWFGMVATVWTREYEDIKEGETVKEARIRLTKKYNLNNIIVEQSVTYRNKWLVSLPQTFRDWQTTDEAIKFYVDFIKDNYPAAFTARADYQHYFKRLIDGNLKYATDPDYSRKCEDLYIQIKNKLK
jgi:flagellum-specific peptidoglycan hydrolase FlgJ